MNKEFLEKAYNRALKETIEKFKDKKIDEEEAKRLRFFFFKILEKEIKKKAG